MRLAVLDVGSNKVHLVVVDAERGARPQRVHAEKTPLRLAEAQRADGTIPPESVAALVRAVARACRSAERRGADELIAFTTSAIREAANGPAIVERVVETTGVRLRVLSGEEEAQTTFLAVRRWFGWSVGRLLVVDIGGGSLELAVGGDERPELVRSLPLGAGRLTRRFLGDGDPPSEAAVRALAGYVDSVLAPAVAPFQETDWDCVAGTSKTLRLLGRLVAAVPDGAEVYRRRGLSAAGANRVFAFTRQRPSAALAEMKGVTPGRARQLLAGAAVADAVLRHLAIELLRLCPWALREGVVLRRLDVTPPGSSWPGLLATHG